jgi:hypothetical protein
MYTRLTGASPARCPPAGRASIHARAVGGVRHGRNREQRPLLPRAGSANVGHTVDAKVASTEKFLPIVRQNPGHAGRPDGALRVAIPEA